MQDFTCTFKGVQRQFDSLEISIVYDKSYQHTTIFDSYDLQLAAKLIKSIKFENTSSTYSFTGKLSDDLEKEEEKFLIYKMLVAHSCDGCSSALLMQYKNNPIYQEITDEDKFTDNTGDGRIYIDMRRSKDYTDELEKINCDDSSHYQFKRSCRKKTKIQNYWVFSSRILVLIIKQGLYYVIQKVQYF